MKKDKKEKQSPRKNWIAWFTTLKHPIFVIVFFLLFIFTGLFTWKFIPKGTSPSTESLRFAPAIPTDLKEKAISETIDSLQAQIAWLSEHVTSLEQKKTQESPLHDFKSIILFENVLTGAISLGVFKDYLEKSVYPEDKKLLNTLLPFKRIATYRELTATLKIEMRAPYTHPSLWDRFEKQLKNFIHIRKVDGPPPENPSHLSEILEALKAQDLHKALHIFGNLDPGEKNALADWKSEAQHRLTAEEIYKTLLSDLAKGHKP